MIGIPFFKPIKEDPETSICIHCGKNYNIRSAEVYNKGNKYFCGKDCILKYEEKWKNE